MDIVITLIVLVLVIAYICCGFRIVPQNNEGLVETLGKYSKTVKAGFVFVCPLLFEFLDLVKVHQRLL